MEPDSKGRYLLITPARNEEKNLPEVSRSVAGQKITPVLWIIVDDGSTDGTPHILEDLKTKYSWIRSIRLPPRPRDITFHYSYVCKQGFDYTLEYCRENGIGYDYIGLLDADTILEENYFGKLIDEFEKDSSLGIASGGVYYDTGGKLSREVSDKNLPRGTGRLWRKACFLETGGYQVEPSPDSISNTKAILRGWQLKQYADVVEVQTRKTSAGEGLWNGYVKNGWMAHYVDKSLPMVLFNTLYYCLKSPYYTGTAYFYGYLNSVIKKDVKIQDMEIRNYYRSQGLGFLFSRVSGVLNNNSTEPEQGEQ
ncbi:glycosyltransferase family 2 protein [Methanosarcina mazei]|jgi:glycosyltransferase involved in cell wall biosynthesis|uniref:Glycosyltransferase family 2 protein n=2 Tax=Methanosarcina mazei TaxID=2209 RepID=A0A6C0VDZ6_METMZ|nr:glycosyltransferase family 2 protein [Methanosarcina mazei]AAM30823.1 glycosyltransferase [Methanosarcina mazei Go1]QIB89779.1 glycosyltransferase family 2 protein [Methanosarcina mazei]WIM44357.1 glycosyltransferase family 2 protein [Methanosarcina mazei]WIM47815.1 glycosyltransferase family 2 protein [Methanosarcina mazei]